MANTRTLVVAVVALVVGALLGYFYVQSQARDLAGRVTVLESDLAAANDLAGSAAAEAEALEQEVATLRAELEERDQRIAELEAGAGQPVTDEPEAAQDEPETETEEPAQDEPETEEVE